jgi:hypothetical protein
VLLVLVVLFDAVTLGSELHPAANTASTAKHVMRFIATVSCKL